MKGKDNPADVESRGPDPRKETSSSRWTSYTVVTCKGDDDAEIKKNVKVNAVQLENDILENVEKRVSNWCKWKRIIVLVLI